MKKKQLPFKNRNHITINGHLESIEGDIKVVATTEVWKKLDELALDDPMGFVEDFFWNIVMPGAEQVRAKERGARASNTKDLVETIKRDAGWLYAFLRYWCNVPYESWPEYLTRIAKEMKANFPAYLDVTTGYIVAAELTLFQLAHVYGEEAKRCGLRPFDSDRYFVREYIHAEKRPMTISRGILRGRSIKEMTELPYHNPLLKRLLISSK